jgi:hypothetical protein
VHVVTELSPEMLAEFDGPIGRGPVIEVDTTRPVDIPGLAAEGVRLLDSGQRRTR